VAVGGEEPARSGGEEEVFGRREGEAGVDCGEEVGECGGWWEREVKIGKTREEGDVGVDHCGWHDHAKVCVSLVFPGDVSYGNVGCWTEARSWDDGYVIKRQACVACPHDNKTQYSIQACPIPLRH